MEQETKAKILLAVRLLELNNGREQEAVQLLETALAEVRRAIR